MFVVNLESLDQCENRFRHVKPFAARPSGKPQTLPVTKFALNCFLSYSSN